MHIVKQYMQKMEMKLKKEQRLQKLVLQEEQHGPHLHFEIKVDSRLVNPENVLKF